MRISKDDFKFRRKNVMTYYELLEKQSNNKLNTKFSLLFKVVGGLICSSLIIFVFKAPILDVPYFFTGNLEVTEGKVDYTYHISRSFYENVIVNGEDIEFYFESNLEIGDLVKIYYLPHTNQAIKVYQPNNTSTGEFKKSPFPFKDVFMYIGFLIIGVAAIMGNCALVMKFHTKVTIINTCIHFPIALYLYISTGLRKNVWFSLDNIYLLALILSLFCILLLICTPFVESISNEDNHAYLDLTQLFSFLAIFMPIAISMDKNIIR